MEVLDCPYRPCLWFRGQDTLLRGNAATSPMACAAPYYRRLPKKISQRDFLGRGEAGITGVAFVPSAETRDRRLAQRQGSRKRFRREIFRERGEAGVFSVVSALNAETRAPPCTKTGLPKKICVAKIFWERGGAACEKSLFARKA